MVEGENTTKLKYNSLKTNKVSALLFWSKLSHRITIVPAKNNIKFIKSNFNHCNF